MTHPVVAFYIRVSIRIAALVAVALALSADSALAQHRAKLSRGLKSQVRDGRPNVRAIYEGPQAEADRLSKERAEGGESARRRRGAHGARPRSSTPRPAIRTWQALSDDSQGARDDGGNDGVHRGEPVVEGRAEQLRRPHGARRDGGDHRLWRRSAAPGYQPQSSEGSGFHRARARATTTATARTWRGSSPGAAAGSGTDSTYVGMAPGAGIVSLKVLTADGTGLVSDVLEAFDWILENKEAYSIRVVNISLGQPAGGRSADDPLAKATARLVTREHHSSGLGGQLREAGRRDASGSRGRLTGYTPEAITVGALNTKGTVARSDDGVATYSSRGPVGIRSSRARGS